MENEEMTNFEKIKAMSIEEIAELLANGCFHCFYYKNGKNCELVTCKQGVDEWLQAEAD